MSLFSKKETVKLDVTGMHCQKCVGHVTEALEGVEGVTAVAVSLEDNAATVEGHGFDNDALIAAVQAAGFEERLSESCLRRVSFRSYAAFTLRQSR